MFKQTFIVFIVLLFCSMVSSDDICGPNAEYRDCGLVCSATCKPHFVSCNYYCETGCFCSPGFMKIGAICYPYIFACKSRVVGLPFLTLYDMAAYGPQNPNKEIDPNQYSSGYGPTGNRLFSARFGPQNYDLSGYGLSRNSQAAGGYIPIPYRQQNYGTGYSPIQSGSQLGYNPISYDSQNIESIRQNCRPTQYDLPGSRLDDYDLQGNGLDLDQTDFQSFGQTGSENEITEDKDDSQESLDLIEHDPSEDESDKNGLYGGVVYESTDGDVHQTDSQDFGQTGSENEFTEDKDDSQEWNGYYSSKEGSDMNDFYGGVVYDPTDVDVDQTDSLEFDQTGSENEITDEDKDDSQESPDLIEHDPSEDGSGINGLYGSVVYDSTDDVYQTDSQDFGQTGSENEIAEDKDDSQESPDLIEHDPSEDRSDMNGLYGGVVYDSTDDDVDQTDYQDFGQTGSENEISEDKNDSHESPDLIEHDPSEDGSDINGLYGGVVYDSTDDDVDQTDYQDFGQTGSENEISEDKIDSHESPDLIEHDPSEDGSDINGLYGGVVYDSTDDDVDQTDYQDFGQTGSENEISEDKNDSHESPDLIEHDPSEDESDINGLYGGVVYDSTDDDVDQTDYQDFGQTGSENEITEDKNDSHESPDLIEHDPSEDGSDINVFYGGVVYDSTDDDVDQTDYQDFGQTGSENEISEDKNDSHESPDLIEHDPSEDGSDINGLYGGVFYELIDDDVDQTDSQDFGQTGIENEITEDKNDSHESPDLIEHDPSEDGSDINGLYGGVFNELIDDDVDQTDSQDFGQTGIENEITEDKNDSHESPDLIKHDSSEDGSDINGLYGGVVYELIDDDVDQTDSQDFGQTRGENEITEDKDVSKESPDLII